MASIKKHLGKEILITDSLLKTYVVIFAGGTGTRMKGASKPKQFLELAGKPIIAHTLQHFQSHTSISGISVACYEPWMCEFKQIVARFSLDKVISIVPGGKTGQDSIYNALTSLLECEEPPSAEDVVLVHDGVRPLVNAETITRCITSVVEHGPTATTAPSTETIVVIENGIVKKVVDRSKCQLARAPQGFRFGDFLDVHERARREDYRSAIDSVSLMARYGYKIFAVPGPEENIKITTQRDFFAFKSFMDMKEVSQIWEPL